MSEPSNIQHNHTELPEPDVDASTRSRELCKRIEALCIESGGAINFSDYMWQALYAPVLGYYTGGLQKFGEQGDFITAPEVSSLFSQCVARQVCDVLTNVDQAQILEFGAGSGVMAADLLLELERLDVLPEKYMILELSAELIQRQRDTIRSRAAHLLERVSWLDRMPDTAFSGAVLANEVLDAMPVECFRKTENGIESLYIRCEQGLLSSEYRQADAAINQAVQTIEQRRGGELPVFYCSEFNPAIAGWLESISAVLRSGMVLLIDYGYTAYEYYHEERRQGTLMCHYRHRAHSDPLWYPGLQDITSFVDFSNVAYSAQAAGFDVSGYTSQALFLMATGLGELHQSLVTDDPKQQIVLAQQIKTLTLPSEMGERFKVMALTKENDEPLRGFAMSDLRDRL